MEKVRHAAMNGWNASPSIPVVGKREFVGKKPNRVIPVHREYQRHVFGRERDHMVNDIKILTDCSVIPHWEQGTGKISQFDIYGAGAGLERAITIINTWISSALTKSERSSAWAKMSAFDLDKWYYEQVDIMEDARKVEFKGAPPQRSDEDDPLPMTLVDWPQDLANQDISPRDVFGNKLEALDALRMYDEVFVCLAQSDDEQWQIQIEGYDALRVELAKEHVETMFERVRMDTFGVQHTLNIMLDGREGIEVELQEAERWWPLQTDKVVPRLLHSPIMDNAGDFREEGLHSMQLASLQHAIKLALEHVRYRKGAYDFVVRLGCLALSSKHVDESQVGKTYEKETFLKDVNGPVDMDVKKWLANEDIGYRILHRLKHAGSFLETIKSAGYFGYKPDELKQTRPICRGTWVFCDPYSSASQARAPVRHAGRPAPLRQTSTVCENASPPPVNIFVVQVDWTDDEEGRYEKGTPRFYRLEPGNGGPKKNMDVNLLELGESRGWQFALESLIPIARSLAPPILTGFVDGVRMRKKWDGSVTESFAEWAPSPTVNRHLVTGRLDSIYSFGVQKTCYKVEMTAMWYPKQKLPVWGLAVRHVEWEAHLAELETLGPGRQASWEDPIGTFLPDDGCSSSYTVDEDDFGMGRLQLDKTVVEPPRDGILRLTNILMKLSNIISSVTAGGGVRLTQRDSH